MLALLASLVTAPVIAAGPVEIALSEPTGDRWMYPFNETPGRRPVAPVFAALGVVGFDDMDSQMVIQFDTSSLVPTGRGWEAYGAYRLRIRVGIANDMVFRYDPTYDPVATYYAEDDPDRIPDEDPGRPLMLYPVGYRGGYSASTWTEYSPFGGQPEVPPAEGARHVFAAVLDRDALATDASRAVRQRFEPRPIAIGRTDALAPGELVPAGTEFVFDADLCSPGLRRFIQEGLDAGMIVLSVAGLHEAQQGGGGAYPVIYTKENAVGRALGLLASIELTAAVGRRSDFDNNGVLDIRDFFAFQAAFAGASPAADLDENCRLDVRDFFAFQSLFAGGR